MAIPLLQPSEEFATSQSDRAYFAIRAMIVRAELAPGSLVSEADLMDTLGLGRTPIREALRTLANESFAASLAAQRSNPDDRVATAQLLTELEALGSSPDPHALLEIDQRMHHHVYRCTHNAYLERTLDQYFVHSLRIWALALHNIPDLQLAVLEHRNLLQAIHDGDADKAAELMFHHVEGFETEIRKTL